MAVLTTSERNRMPASQFAVAGRRFPIPDKAHARNALARLNQVKGLSEEQKHRVIAMANAKLGHKGKAEERGEHTPEKKEHEE